MEQVKVKGPKLVIMSIILGLSIVGSAGVIAKTMLDIKKMDGNLVVTGSTKQIVASDFAKLRGSFTRESDINNLKTGYEAMKQDEKKVREFLTKNGIEDKNIDISPVAMNEIYDYTNQNASVEKPKKYSLYQSVEISTNDVNKIKDIATKSSDLINSGVIFSIQAPEYYYTKLADARISLIDGAIKDAKQRASVIAKSSDKEIASILSASMGVVQVSAPNSIDVSDYGTYDTSSIEKEIMITVKATFSFK